MEPMELMARLAALTAVHGVPEVSDHHRVALRVEVGVERLLAARRAVGLGLGMIDGEETAALRNRPSFGTESAWQRVPISVSRPRLHTPSGGDPR